LFGEDLEKILLERLKKLVLTNDLIPDEQFGFMPGCSSVNQTNVTSGFERNMTTISVFLDISRAYDTT
jgi:Reverse transcriptase (RNA-dependent DNA polymerase).